MVILRWSINLKQLTLTMQKVIDVEWEISISSRRDNITTVMYVWHSFTNNPHGTYDFVQHKSWVVRVKKSYIHFWYKTIKSIKYAVMETDLNLPDLIKLRIKPREIRRRRWITRAVSRVPFYRPIKVLYHQETGHIAIGLIFTMIKNLNLSSLLVLMFMHWLLQP